MPYPILQPAFVGGEWTPALQMRVDLDKYGLALAKSENFVIHPHGGASNRAGTEYCGTLDRRAWLVEFQFNVEQSYALEFSDKRVRIFKDGGLVINPESSEVVEITIPYEEGDIPNIRYTQSADVLYLVHNDFPPAKLSRYSHHEWVYEPLPFESTLDTPIITSSTTGNNVEYVNYEEWGSIRYRITAYSDDDESLGSDIVCAGEGEVVKWNPVTGATGYSIYRNDYGIYGWIKDVVVCEYKVKETKPDLEVTIPMPFNPFEDGDYPSVVGIHEQRLILTRTRNRPQTFFMSKSGNFDNFNKSEPLRADDSCEFTIGNGQVNDIRAIVSMSDMILLTAGNEYKVTGKDGKGITPTSISVKKQSGTGSAFIDPLLINSSILYISNSQKAISDMAYSLEADGYTGNDLTILANHLLKGRKIIAWAYQRNPDSIVWCVRDDGVLIGLTYKKDQQVWAWHRHNTHGVFEDVKVVSDGSGIDDVYFIVKREIAGVEKRFVERFKRERMKDNDIKNAFFVDSGLSLYSPTPVSIVSGLEHLAGMDVVGLTDGNPIRATVSDTGTVELPQEASTVHIGLPFTSNIETLNIIANTQEGSSFGKTVVVRNLTVCVQDTASLKVSPDNKVFDTLKIRTNEELGKPTKLKTGDAEFSLSGVGRKSGGKIYLQNTDPLPVTVIGIIPELDIGDIN